MKIPRRLVPSPAMAVALLALFVALGGVSYGIATNSIGTKQVRNNSIGSVDVHNGSLTGRDVKNSSLTGRDVKKDSLTGDDVNEGQLGPISPSGAAGGALTGTFPNPGIAAGAVGPTQLANGSVAPRHQSTIPAVRAPGTPSQSIPNAVFTALPFAATPFVLDFDTDGMHSTTTNPERLTARTAGVYVVSTVVSWGTNATGTRTLGLQHVRGTTSTTTTMVQGPASAAGVVQNFTMAVKMEVGDYVEVLGAQNSGAPLASVFPIWFSAVWTGP